MSDKELISRIYKAVQHKNKKNQPNLKNEQMIWKDLLKEYTNGKTKPMERYSISLAISETQIKTMTR